MKRHSYEEKAGLMRLKLNWLVSTAVLMAVTMPSHADVWPPRNLPKVEQQGMDCSPSALRQGDTLSVKLPLSHGGDFAVVDPTGKYFFIAFTQPDKSSKVQPIIPADIFARMKETSLAIAEVKGIPWNRGDATPTLIFRRNGTYRLLVSQTLETEDPVLDGWCNIHFKK